MSALARHSGALEGVWTYWTHWANWLRAAQ